MFNFQPNKEARISFGRPQTGSYVDKETVIGREKDKEDIVRFLINHDVSNKKKIMVLPIVAMGGMGKTTICQLVYRDHRVESHFQLLIWVCVSDVDFDVARIVRLIIEAATNGECKLENMVLLQNKLREIISGKSYLIVLDDVWNENPNQWDRLKRLLDCGGEGSAVVVSTRCTLTAKMMATHINTIHYLKQLSEEDGWELFRSKAFAEGAEEPARLVEIGKDITKRCGGLPLAIDTFGSMMRFKNDEEWKVVLDIDIWMMQAAKDNILPTLRLSYNYLPPHLKQCFVFCATFPKDYEMEKETLIQLWMANGYITSDGESDLDVMGRGIFDVLVWRSFFQNSVDGLDVTKCKMHDLMHDLAQSIMGKECLNFEHTPKWEDISSISKHLYLPNFPQSSSPMSESNLPKIRTIVKLKRKKLVRDKFDEQELSIKHVLMLKSLRVLDLSFLHFNVSVKHLRHLRWLNLSYSTIKELPEGICSLYNLQTLILYGCIKLRKLPENFTDLVNLRYLYISECNVWDGMPKNMGRLKRLCTLTNYVASAEAERGIEQLHDLNNLGGKLELYRIGKVTNAKDAENASLSSKKNLRSIKLSWEEAGSLEVFEALKPHNRLRELEVEDYGGQQFPRWMNDPQQLQYLVDIKLKGCKKCKELPSFGHLPFLESLKLISMDEVKHIISKTTWCDREVHTKLFPSLKKLFLDKMKNLEDWWQAEESNALALPDKQQFLPCLMNLVIQHCKNLTTIPAISSLQNLTLESSNPNLTTLSSFTIDKGLAGISQLQSLKVSNCPDLVYMPACIPSIYSLSIIKCNNLKSLPESGCLTKLQYIELWGCDGLESLPQGMKALTSLQISFCKGLRSLPEDLIKLYSLILHSCDGLASLPQGMESLTKLEISLCNGLTSLPKSLIKLQSITLKRCDCLLSLPEGTEGLTKLKYLEIENCKRLRSLPEGLELPSLTTFNMMS